MEDEVDYLSGLQLPSFQIALCSVNQLATEQGSGTYKEKSEKDKRSGSLILFQQWISRKLNRNCLDVLKGTFSKLRDDITLLFIYKENVYG